MTDFHDFQSDFHRLFDSGLAPSALSLRLNKTPFSGKNNNFLQNWKDFAKFIGNKPKHKMEMQIIYDDR